MIVRGCGRLNIDRHFYSTLTEHQFMLTKVNRCLGFRSTFVEMGRPVHGLLMLGGNSWNY